MKTLKFKNNFIPKILSGEKTITWRLFDDKDLTVGDELSFINVETGEVFARARITNINRKKLGEARGNDLVQEYAVYADKDLMLKNYHSHYGDSVTLDSPLKIITFELLPA